jgi:nitrate reductase cytochrome c-type subunit
MKKAILSLLFFGGIATINAQEKTVDSSKPMEMKEKLPNSENLTPEEKAKKEAMKTDDMPITPTAVEEKKTKMKKEEKKLPTN